MSGRLARRDDLFSRHTFEQRQRETLYFELDSLENEGNEFKAFC